MKVVDLGGHWTAFQSDGKEEIPAQVPGCIHTDLMALGEIPDPYYRDNESSLFWVGQKDWTYVKTFDVDSVLLSYERIVLQCDGLDTLATVYVNDRKVGTADNQFRRWEYDIKRFLFAGANEIEVRFRSTFPAIKAKKRGRKLAPLEDGLDRIAGGNWLRKSQCNYGWDWGPKCVTCGIWRPVKVIGWDRARIGDVHIRQKHLEGGVAQLNVAVAVERKSMGRLHAEVSVYDGKKLAARKKALFRQDKARLRLEIPDPKLWWPNGMGKQPLYDVTVEIIEERDSGFLETAVLDTVKKTIGLRTLRLVQEKDRWGRSFSFEANGKRFFVKGANWIPADTFVTRVSPETYEELIRSAADANMNMLRVWGGGIYEDDLFYELCDRYGICIWQDFMFACSAYPAFDQRYLENVRVEVEEQVARLRHHPCMALWCGNNELEQIKSIIGDDEETGQMSWTEYKALFDRLIPGVVKGLDPDRGYWPSSPHSPVGDRNDHNNPRCGDAHLWDVWHGRKPFEWYRSCEHRFNSEFGFQSFPEPRVAEGYTEAEDRNITSYVMEHHQRSAIGNSAIIDYMLEWFRLPIGFAMTLWVSQILQGMAVKYAVEHWRRRMPQGMGTLYWQLNDCWPVASWSSIDYQGNWKALHYMARRFYSPLLISGVEDEAKDRLDVYVSSDRLSGATGQISIDITDTHGVRIRKEELEVRIPAQKSRKVVGIDLGEELREYGARRLMIWMALKVEGKPASVNLALFARPKHLELRRPEIRSTVKQRRDGGFTVTLRSKYPALWVWPELRGHRARYSDRFFHIPPFSWEKVTIYPEKPMSMARFQKNLEIHSLVDTYDV